MDFNDRLKEARQKAGLTQAELAQSIAINQSTIAYWENGRSEPDTQKLQKLAEILNVTPEWLTFGKTPGTNPFLSAGIDPALLPAKDLPIRGMVQAGQHQAFLLTDDPVSFTDRPPNLAGNKHAFAVWVSGKSMEPRYRAGEVLYVNPAKPVSEGCCVLIELDDNSAFVKEFIRQSRDRVLVRQYNPQREIEIDCRRVRSLYRVVGSMEG